MLAKLTQFVSRTLRPRVRKRAPFLISISICIVSLGLYAAVYMRPQPNAVIQFLANIELKTLDVRFQLRGGRPPGPAVVVVAVDQKSEDVLGRWPFPRSYFAQAVNFLRDAHARVIAFDFNFPQADANSGLEALRSVREDYDRMVDPSLHAPGFESRLKSREVAADNDQQFAAALSHFDNAILGYFDISREAAKSQNQERLKEFLDILSYQAYPQIVNPQYAKDFNGPIAVGISPNLPQFSTNAKNFGFLDIVSDPDGVVRREPTVVLIQGSFYPSLDVAAALAYSNNALDQVKVVFDPSGVERIVLGERIIPTDPQGFVHLDYDGGAHTFPTYSLADVVQRRVATRAIPRPAGADRPHRPRH